MCADRGASVWGLDAAAGLLELARARVPAADLRLADLQVLPYEDDAFDVVTGFTSFFFADDMVAALREAARFAEPGAPVVIQVWGNPEHSDIELMKALVRPYMPPPPPDQPARDGALQARRVGGAGDRGRARAAGGVRRHLVLRVRRRAGAGRRDDGRRRGVGAGRARSASRTCAVRSSTRSRPSARPDGRYRLENEYRILIARA